jgi:hypothetical protein
MCKVVARAVKTPSSRAGQRLASRGLIRCRRQQFGDLLDSTTISAWAPPTGHAFYQIRKAGKALGLKVLPVCWRWSTSDRMKGRELIIPARRRRKTRVRLWAFSDVALGAGVVDALA